MHRILPIFILSVLGISVTPLVGALPSIAYRQMASTVGASMHLEPHDMPRAKQSSPTWFVLTQRGGSLIPAGNCACQVAVYNSSHQVIAQSLPLSTVLVETHQAISTTMNFPNPGTYTVVLSGRSKDESFHPFELTFPVIVSP
ncbi:MAG: hypothetical protein KME15_21015 [Drouetiella hepatica Uher 2000/2452]|jgi:hypothetical protein|uniref:Uncharacterized protein n=1 Tax=Drouetiella hepatica Uher 2000/2452 TaxID=904376 RepID=A0A951QEN2_9CYAN|nr:hypothetical protein [Drouetiella hepatica Uher 2000/2452]